MVSCQKGPTRYAYAWQIGSFWQDTLKLWGIYDGDFGENWPLITASHCIMGYIIVLWKDEIMRGSSVVDDYKHASWWSPRHMLHWIKGQDGGVVDAAESIKMLSMTLPLKSIQSVGALTPRITVTMCWLIDNWSSKVRSFLVGIEELIWFL